MPARLRRPGSLLVLVLLVALAASAPAPLGAQDNGNPVRPVPGDDPQQPWADAIAAREVESHPVAAAPRTLLKVGSGYVYYVRLEWPAEPEDEEAGDADDNGPRQWAPPEVVAPSRRVLCRVPIAVGSGMGGGEQELLELGAYPFDWLLLSDGSGIVAAQQVDDTNGDGTVDTADDVRIVVGATSGGDWTEIHVGPGSTVLAAALPDRRELLLVTPGAAPFEREIQRVPIGGGPLQVLTHGIFVECVTPDEDYVVVARTGEMPDDMAMRMGPRGMRWMPDNADDEYALTRAPVHVLVPLQPGEAERVLLPGEDWSRVVAIGPERAWYETMVLPPHYNPEQGHPTWQSRNVLAYLQRETLTPVPVTSDPQYDNQYVGQVPGRGVLYLHNTNINRHLTLFTDADAHLRLFEHSPLTPAFALAPNGQRLWFLEYAPGTTAPFDPLRTPTVLRSLDLTE